jgi:aspartyl-tRNA(Asn)/glutamyl-tRNA(Gln) amidotransferase subunit A
MRFWDGLVAALGWLQRTASSVGDITNRNVRIKIAQAPALGICDSMERMSRREVTSSEMLEDCLVRIKDPAGEGSRVFIRLFEAEARASATAWDQMRHAGVPLPVLAGLPISVKDLFDVANSVTTAGSLALKDRQPAREDAFVVARLRSAGAVIVGTTNMTEFAMGGLGLNPHYGTPLNPFDRKVGRIPGGSSSGAAVSVTDGMAIAAIGTDTAGSVQMPAAFCGLVGFKPTARRVPLDGSIPLARSLDSVGPIAPSVKCCAILDSVLAGSPLQLPAPVPISGLRFGVPTTLVLNDLAPEVATVFSRSLSKLSKAGARIEEFALSALEELPSLNMKGGLTVAEGYAWHRRLLETKAPLYDPIIAARFHNGASVSMAEYIELREARARLIQSSARQTANFDALLFPTVPLTAPPLAQFENNESLWLSTNRLMIRNPGIANFLDRCALSVPCHEPGEAPMGLSIMGETMSDQRILAIGMAVEGLMCHEW